MKQNTEQPIRGVRHKHKILRQRRPGESRAQPRAASVPRLPAVAEPATLVPGLRGPCGGRGGPQVRSGEAGVGRGAAEELPPHRAGGGRREKAARLGSAEGPRSALGGLGRPAVGSGSVPTGALVPLRRLDGAFTHVQAAEPRCYSAGRAGLFRRVPCAISARRSCERCAPHPACAQLAPLIPASSGREGVCGIP